MQHAAVQCQKCRLPAPPAATGAWGVRFECKGCGLHGYNGRPLVDQATHDARQDAHNYFDRLWHFGRMTRPEAYKALAEQMQMKPSDCHISRMDKETALAVRGHVDKIFKKEGA